VLLAAGLFAVRILFRIVGRDDDPPREFRLRSDRMILIGATPVASSFIRLLNTCAPDRQHVIAVLDADPNMIGRAVSGVQVVGRPLDLEAIVNEYAIHGVTTNRVVVAGEVDSLAPVVLREIEHICQRHHITLSLLPRMIGLTDPHKGKIAAISGPELTKPSIALPAYLGLKRCIDVMGSLALLLLLSPLFIAVAGLVLFDVGRPVLFWQERLGWKGRAFLIYKFRTLAAPFDFNGNPLRGKRQPSAIGRMLRLMRFDELPQLLNVLFGDMSLIGPRPLLPEDQPANTAMRLLVRPGISGWAQVNGGKVISKEDKERLDEWYIRNASLRVDFQIVMMTLKIVLMRQHQDAEADAEQVQRKNLPLMRQHQDAEPDAEQVQGKHLPLEAVGEARRRVM
jgi:lipopolysaccharide/colanic/teichoic acid biosynthesis glycosyltransferase